MNFLRNSSTVLVGSFMLLSAAGARGDDTAVVDCSRGDSIQQALGKQNPGRPLTVLIRGACTEQVTVKQDDVTLEGDQGAIAGSVTIDGGRRVLVAHLTITNPTGDGVTVANGGSATIRNNHIDNNAGYGVFLRNAAFAIVNNNTMLNNGVINPTTVDASGIGVAMGSTVRALENEIRENANTGIEVFDNSTYRSEGDILAMRTAAPPGRSAMDTFRAGYVDLRRVSVNGVVQVNQQSQLQVRNVAGFDASTITGNINVSGLSFLRLRAGVQRLSSTLSCVALSICTCDGFPSCP
jgi:parallel beta-helix repeat protein